MPKIATKNVVTVAGPHGLVVIRDGACLSESDWSAAIKHRAVIDMLEAGTITVEADPAQELASDPPKLTTDEDFRKG